MLGRQGNFIYFPAYVTYYNRTDARYTYWDGRLWVSQTEPPRGVVMEVLQGSPSVAMGFHDAPGRHHPEVALRYPRDWLPPGVVIASSP